MWLRRTGRHDVLWSTRRLEFSAALGSMETVFDCRWRRTSEKRQKNYYRRAIFFFFFINSRRYSARFQTVFYRKSHSDRQRPGGWFPFGQVNFIELYEAPFFVYLTDYVTVGNRRKKREYLRNVGLCYSVDFVFFFFFLSRILTFLPSTYIRAFLGWLRLDTVKQSKLSGEIRRKFEIFFFLRTVAL